MNCFCNYPVRVKAASVVVATGITTVTVPESVEFLPGVVYDVILSTPIPDGTEGTQIAITNGTTSGTLYKYNGNYRRAHGMSSRTMLRAQFFDDPEHFMFIPRR